MARRLIDKSIVIEALENFLKIKIDDVAPTKYGVLIYAPEKEIKKLEEVIK